jgi:hypothetical protein
LDIAGRRHGQMNPGIPGRAAGFSAEGKTGMGQRFLFKFRVHNNSKTLNKKTREQKHPCSLVFQSNNKTPVPRRTDLEKSPKNRPYLPGNCLKPSRA